MAQIPTDAVARYRICTEKSLLGFGKYADLPVGDILKIDEEYIVWAYAFKEKISFKKEILERLGVREIEKPGTDESVLWDWKKKREEGYTKEQRLHGVFAKARGKKKQAIAILRRACRETSFTKGQLQANNHGHIKLK